MEPEIRRESINDLRKPITGIREAIRWSDVCDENMTWDTQYKKLNNYIKYIAGQVAPGLQSSMMSAEDLYQEGLLLLYTCFDKYKLKPENEFQAIFKSSCWRLLRGFCYKKKEVVTVDLDDCFDMGYTPDMIDEMYSQFQLKQVYELMAGNPDAIKIFNEFLKPSEKTFWEADMDYQRKLTLRSQGKSVSVPSDIRVRPLFVRKALSMTDKQFRAGFKVVQSSVFAVYNNDYTIKNYTEPDDSMTDEEFQERYNLLMATISKLHIA
jgi:hypothetical protein